MDGKFVCISHNAVDRRVGAGGVGGPFAVHEDGDGRQRGVGCMQVSSGIRGVVAPWYGYGGRGEGKT